MSSRTPGGKPVGRKSLGQDGRTVTKTVKVTAREAEFLTRRYGSVTTALRVGLDRLLPESVTNPTTTVRPRAVAASQDTFDTTCGPRMSDHPGWKEIARGTKTRTIIKECRVCGVRVTERQP